MLPLAACRAFRHRFAMLCCAVSLGACSSGESTQSLIDSGKQYLAKKDDAAAVIQFKSALQKDPSSQEARVLLGEALMSSDIDGAILELTKALNEKVPAAKVLPTLTRALLLAGDYSKLATTYSELSLDDRPAQAAVKANVASAWGALGDKARTEAAVAASLGAMPDYGPAKLLQARLLAGQGRFDEAAAVVDAALAGNDRFHEAWLLRGEILEFGKSDLKSAEDAYRKALAAEKSYVLAHSALIAVRIRQRDVEGARAQADQLRAAMPRHPYTTLVDAQFAFIDQKYARARDLVQLLLRSSPDHKAALLLAGAVETRLGSLVQAAAYLNKALLANPGMEAARRSLAEVEIRLGQHSKALETLKPLLTGGSPTAEALALAGDAELRMGNSDTAWQHYNRAAKLDPGDSRLPAAAALARLWAGDASSAFADLQQLSTTSKETYADEILFAARMRRREYDSALTTLETMIKKEPGKVAHIEMRGRVHLARRDLPAARQAFEQALKADPAMFSAVGSLAQIDLLEGKAPQALARLQASVDADPKNAFAMMAFADMKSRTGGPADEVGKLYRAATMAAPTLAEPRLRLIDLALRQRQYKQALQAAQDGLAAMPGDVQILDAAGQAQMRAGDIEQAQSTFRKLATALPMSPRPYQRLAELYSVSGKREQAESALTMALEIAPDNAESQKALVDLIASSAGQRGAAQRLRRITQKNPKLALGYLLEAEYHVRRKDVDAASAVLREGLSKTGRPDMAAKLFRLFRQSGRSEEAERFGTAWMKQHPKDAAFEYLVAESDIERGNLRVAEQRLRRVLASYPDNVPALNNLAWVVVNNGGVGAVGYAQRAVDLMPDSPPLMDTLALALLSEKQTPRALAVQKRAVELSPKDDQLRLGLAKIALEAGETALAKQELLHLQKLGSSFHSQAEVGKLLQGL
ncbi:MAG: PEP-CTERM system TPR-repeat protein PrsT [Leptothrix sp. (in: Bacteria)]|nr:PEP-CTERM system TPR-repeat protein PrsT [Leptothrix sp. (in: b-proteobacteria)]